MTTECGLHTRQEAVKTGTRGSPTNLMEVREGVLCGTYWHMVAAWYAAVVFCRMGVDDTRYNLICALNSPYTAPACGAVPACGAEQPKCPTTKKTPRTLQLYCLYDKKGMHSLQDNLFTFQLRFLVWQVCSCESRHPPIYKATTDSRTKSTTTNSNPPPAPDVFHPTYCQWASEVALNAKIIAGCSQRSKLLNEAVR